MSLVKSNIIDMDEKTILREMELSTSTITNVIEILSSPKGLTKELKDGYYKVLQGYNTEQSAFIKRLLTLNE